MKLLGTLYFIIKLLIITASIMILFFINKKKVIKDSKSEIKDNIKEAVASNDLSKQYVLERLLNFYNIFLQSNITAIITIILFFGEMALTYFTKIKIRIKFIIKLIMIGLLISFIIIASTIDDNLNKETYDLKEKKFKTFRTQINELINVYDNDSEKKELEHKLQALLSTLDNLRINSYTNFSLIIFLLVTKIYK